MAMRGMPLRVRSTARLGDSLVGRPTVLKLVRPCRARDGRAVYFAASQNGVRIPDWVERTSGAALAPVFKMQGLTFEVSGTTRRGTHGPE